MDYFSMNRSRTRERERKSEEVPRWKNGIFPWENGILSAPRTSGLREECQPSYVPQSPSGDFVGVSILPRAGRQWLWGEIRISVRGEEGIGQRGVGRTVSYDFRLAPAIVAVPTAL